MLIGILWAIFAGITLGLYALPEKFTKEFEFENTWGLFFAINMYVVPIAACLIFVNGFTEILSAIPATVLLGMSIAGFLWGIGVMMWGKAINYIGLSLGFSIFIGTVILVGSLIPFGVNGLPKGEVLGDNFTGYFDCFAWRNLQRKSGNVAPSRRHFGKRKHGYRHQHRRHRWFVGHGI